GHRRRGRPAVGGDVVDVGGVEDAVASSAEDVELPDVRGVCAWAVANRDREAGQRRPGIGGRVVPIGPAERVAVEATGGIEVGSVRAYGGRLEQARWIGGTVAPALETAQAPASAR